MISLGTAGALTTAGFFCLSTATGLYFYQALTDKAKWQRKHPDIEWAPTKFPAESFLVLLWKLLIGAAYVALILKICDTFLIAPSSWSNVLMPWRWF